MKIGYFVPQFPGQTHAFFWREITALEGLGAEVLPLSTRRPRKACPHRWAKAAQGRTTYLFPPSVGDVNRAAMALAGRLAWPRDLLRGRTRTERAQIVLALPFAFGLRRISKRAGIEHVHVGSCGWTALIAALARTLGGPSYSLTLHSSVRIFGPLQDVKWGGAAFGTAVSTAVLEELRSDVATLPDLVLVQSMGVDTDRFRRELPYVPWSPGTPLEIFACGRLNRAKGHEILLQAVSRLRADGIDARLTIAGEDDHGGRGYRKQLEARIADASLDDAVTLLGAVDEDTLVAQMQKSHVFALASLAEAIGVAYMEAMSCELPTIGTDVGGVPELIEDGVNGLMVPSGDAGALAAALRRVISDRELAFRLSGAGRQTILQRFRATIGAERVLGTIAALESGDFRHRAS